MLQRMRTGYADAVSITLPSSVQTAVPRSLKRQEDSSVISADGHLHRERLHRNSALTVEIFLMRTIRYNI